MERAKSKLNRKQQELHLSQEKYINIELNLLSHLKNFKKDEQYTIPIFIPHKGCKNDCVFCNQKRISGRVYPPTYDEVDKQIKEYLGYYNKKDNNIKIEVAFFGGSFTGISIDEQINYLKIANKYLKLNKITGIRISTRPDYISPAILNILKLYNVTTIELGVQSMDDGVLIESKRGHKANDVIRASRLIRLWGFELGHQIMIGLPKSSYDTERYTINEVLKLRASQLRIYPVYVIEESQLYDMYLKGTYIPLTIDEAILRVHEVVKVCMESDIKIIRLGLQSTDEITQKNSKIVGPVCDNFAEYVMAYIVRDEIKRIINKKGLEKYEKIIFRVPKKYTSVVIGPKKINKKYFQENYNIEIGVENI